MIREILNTSINNILSEIIVISWENLSAWVINEKKYPMDIMYAYKYISKKYYHLDCLNSLFENNFPKFCGVVKQNIFNHLSFNFTKNEMLKKFKILYAYYFTRNLAFYDIYYTLFNISDLSRLKYFVCINDFSQELHLYLFIENIIITRYIAYTAVNMQPLVYDFLDCDIYMYLKLLKYIYCTYNSQNLYNLFAFDDNIEYFKYATIINKFRFDKYDFYVCKKLIVAKYFLYNNKYISDVKFSHVVISGSVKLIKLFDNYYQCDIKCVYDKQSIDKYYFESYYDISNELPLLKLLNALGFSIKNMYIFEKILRFLYYYNLKSLREIRLINETVLYGIFIKIFNNENLDREKMNMRCKYQDRFDTLHVEMMEEIKKSAALIFATLDRL